MCYLPAWIWCKIEAFEQPADQPQQHHLHLLCHCTACLLHAIKILPCKVLMLEVGHAAVQVPARRQVHARLDQGQRARWSDAWAFVGMDGRSRGFVSNAMMMAFWIKSKKLLAQTLVYHASGGVQQGQALSKIHKQWRGAILDSLPLNLPCCCKCCPVMLLQVHPPALCCLTVLPR